MKVALVGVGKIAVDQHVPAIANSDDWELGATVSRHGTVDGVPAYQDLSQMLAEKSDIRVVSLCLPPVPRFEYAALAIAEGRHVMLEKPPGATITECLSLKQMAKEKGVALYATWHSRQADKVPAAKAWLKNKKLQKLTITWHENVRQWHPGQDWIFEPGGLGVFDPGINALSILTEILPVPVHVREAKLAFPENRQAPIAARCEFYHPQGAEVSMDLDFLVEGTPTWTIDVQTDQGRLMLENGGGKLTIDGTETEALPGLSGEYPRLYAQMAQLVRDGDIDMDLSPMRHVADAFTLGKREFVAPFEW